MSPSIKSKICISLSTISTPINTRTQPVVMSVFSKQICSVSTDIVHVCLCWRSFNSVFPPELWQSVVIRMRGPTWPSNKKYKFMRIATLLTTYNYPCFNVLSLYRNIACVCVCWKCMRQFQKDTELYHGRPELLSNIKHINCLKSSTYCIKSKCENYQKSNKKIYITRNCFEFHIIVWNVEC